MKNRAVKTSGQTYVMRLCCCQCKGVAPYVGKVARHSHFGQLDQSSILRNHSPWPMPLQLDALAPQVVSVPSEADMRNDQQASPDAGCEVPEAVWPS